MKAKVGGIVVGFKADCLTRDSSLWVECPLWGVFLRDTSPYLRVFRKKPRYRKDKNANFHLCRHRPLIQLYYLLMHNKFLKIIRLKNKYEKK